MGGNCLLTRAVDVPKPGEIPRHERFYYLELLRRAGLIDALPAVRGYPSASRPGHERQADDRSQPRAPLTVRRNAGCPSDLPKRRRLGHGREALQLPLFGIEERARSFAKKWPSF